MVNGCFREKPGSTQREKVRDEIDRENERAQENEAERKSGPQIKGERESESQSDTPAGIWPDGVTRGESTTHDG